MAETRQPNPFADEKPKIVHLEKDQSHYEYCRMKMHDINRVHQRTFVYNLALCIAVCLLSIFKVYVGGFDMLTVHFRDPSLPSAILTNGIFTILIAMLFMILGYLAWANYHSLNIILTAWYTLVTIIGVWRLDYVTAIVGIIGVVVYFFSLREMGTEAKLAEMEGYPEFQEKFDISKSDIVIQTLLAHQGEHKSKPSVFSTDYSLRRRKKTTFADRVEQEKESSAGSALAETLQQKLSDVRDERAARTAIASLEAVTAAQEREGKKKSKKMQTLEDDITESAKPVEEAAEAVAESAKPVAEAAEAVAESAKPVAEAAEAVAESAKPVEEAAEAVAESAKPVEEAAEAVAESAEAAKPANTGAQRPQGGKRKKKKHH